MRPRLGVEALRIGDSPRDYANSPSTMIHQQLSLRTLISPFNSTILTSHFDLPQQLSSHIEIPTSHFDTPHAFVSTYITEVFWSLTGSPASAMPARPARKIFPTAKLTAENAGDLELTAHRRAVASASAALTAPPPKSSSPLPESSPPPPTDTDDATTDSLQVQSLQTSTKRRSEAMSSSLSLDSIIVISPTTSDGGPISTPPTKKAKISASSGQESSLVADSSIIDIDDIDDPCEERLNKSFPTADIKHFFLLVPHVPGQTKRQMKCNLCV